ncbi:hypothetical protein C0993_010274 [Termitomyces sp. T159_Od127]|nr:hypothetical protein C0993_010274 [Termitomyces sp. T159_Od127]
MAPKRNTNTNWDPILLISQADQQYVGYMELVRGIRGFGAVGRKSAMGCRKTDGMDGWTLYAAGSLRCVGLSPAPQSTYTWLALDPVILLTLKLESYSIFYLYTLVRRPRLILDFTLTLLLNHLVLTSYYSASIPTSGFFWLIMIAGAIFTVTMAEQFCVKREMSEGLSVPPVQVEDEMVEEMELGSLLQRRD